MIGLTRGLLVLVLCWECSNSENSTDSYGLAVTDSDYVTLREKTYPGRVYDAKSVHPNFKDYTYDTDQVELSDSERVLRTLFLPQNKYDGASTSDGQHSSREELDSSFGDNERSDVLRSHPYLAMTESNYEDSLESPCNSPTLIRKIQRTNRTKTSKSGKTYVITKVIKSRKCKKRRTGKTQEVQRRTFNLMPNLSSIMHIPWMTKKTEDAEGVVGKGRKTANPPPKYRGNEKIQTEDVTQGPPQQSYNLDKYKKVLSLFTIVKFDNGDCYASGIKGTCLHQIECQAKGGKPIGTCAKGFGICCYVERSCGDQTRENCTYFVNDGFPKPSTIAPKVCTLVVEKAHPEVEQLRLEFMIFELRGPTNGTCLSDRFTITGHNVNHVVPDLCGINSQQHVYVDVDEAKGPYNLNIVTMGEEFPRTFQIKVTQIKRNDELLAPKNCLQYYTEMTGVVQTFNYQYGDLGNLPQAVPGYFNNMNYAICLKKNAGFCSVSYENEDRESGRDNPTFQMLNTNLDGEILLPPQQGGAEVFDCPDDYIIVNGIRLCGERLNDATIDADYTKNYPVTDFSNGPFILQVRTNSAVNGRGFYLRYRQNPCLQ